MISGAAGSWIGRGCPVPTDVSHSAQRLQLVSDDWCYTRDHQRILSLVCASSSRPIGEQFWEEGEHVISFSLFPSLSFCFTLCNSLSSSAPQRSFIKLTSIMLPSYSCWTYRPSFFPLILCNTPTVLRMQYLFF